MYWFQSIFYTRYQIEAAAKIVGGLDYTYALRGDGQMISQMLKPSEQLKSLKSLIKTLKARISHFR